MSDELLRVDGVRKNYGPIEVLHGVSLSATRGEVFAIIGPNGAGKTTMFKVMTGEVPCTGGTIRFEGKDVTRLPAHERRSEGRSVPDIEPRVLERLGRRVEGDDVAGVDDDASGDLDPHADSGTPDRVNDGKSGQAEGTDPHPVRGLEHDSFRQRHLREKLVGDGGGEHGRIGAFAESPGVVGVGVRNEDRVRPDSAQ